MSSTYVTGTYRGEQPIYPIVEVSSNYTIPGFSPIAVLLVNGNTDNVIITLPKLRVTGPWITSGYYVNIRRTDTNHVNIVKILPGSGDTINGLSEVYLSPGELSQIVVPPGATSTDWKFINGYETSLMSIRDLATTDATKFPGLFAYNNNAGFGPIGPYYSDGTIWQQFGSGSVTVNTQSPIIGDGTIISPIRITPGVEGDVLQYVGGAWMLSNSLVNTVLFVDTGGDNATAQPNNPFRPYATIYAAKTAAIALPDVKTIYVRPGNYSDAQVGIPPGGVLVADNLYYYFMPYCELHSSRTYFNINALTVTNFKVFGYGQFNDVRVINISNSSISYVYFEFESCFSTDTCVFIDSPGTESYITVRREIRSSANNAIHFRSGVGTINADTIANGLVPAIQIANNLSPHNLRVSARIITSTVGQLVRIESNTNTSIITASEMRVSGANSNPPIEMLGNSNVTINSRSISATNVNSVALPFVIRATSGVLTLSGSMRVSSSSNSNRALTVESGARVNLDTSYMQGINSRDNFTGILSGDISELSTPAASNLAPLTCAYPVTNGSRGVISLDIELLSRNNNATPGAYAIELTQQPGIGVPGSLRIALNINTCDHETISVGRTVVSSGYSISLNILSLIKTSFNFTPFFISGGQISTNFTRIISTTSSSIFNLGSSMIPGDSTTIFITGDLVSSPGSCIVIGNATGINLNSEINISNMTVSGGTNIFTITNPGTTSRIIFNGCYMRTNSGAIGTITNSVLVSPGVIFRNTVSVSENLTAPQITLTNVNPVLIYGIATSNTALATFIAVGSNVVSALVT